MRSVHHRARLLIALCAGAVGVVLPAPARAAPTPPAPIVESRAVAVVSPGPGRLDAFVRTPADGSLAHAAHTPATGWSAWEIVPGARLDVDSEVAAVSRAPGIIDVFVRSTDDRILSTSWSRAEGWAASWAAIAGAVEGGPSVARRPDGNLTVAAISRATPSMTVPPATAPRPAAPAVPQVITWDPSSRVAIDSWFKLPAAVLPGTSPAIAFRGGTLELFATSPGRALLNVSRPVGGPWSAWRTQGDQVLSSSPAVSPHPSDPNRLDLAARGASGQSLHGTSVSSGSAVAWENLGGAIVDAATPAVSWFREHESAPARLESFVLGSGGGVFRRSLTPTVGWGASYAAATTVRPDPAAPPLGVSPSGLTVVSPSNGRLDAFARGPADGSLLHMAWTSATGWTPWDSMGLRLDADSEISAVATPGRIDLFVRGTNRQAMTKTWTASSGWGASWSTLPGVITAGPTAARAPDGTFTVASTAGTVPQLATWNPATKSAGPWLQLGGAWVWGRTAPAVAYRGTSGALDVFIAGGNSATGALYVNSRAAGASWSGWKNRGGALTGSPSVAARPAEPARIDITARGGDGTAFHAISTAPGVISAAQTLGGTLTPGSSVASVWWKETAAAADRLDVFALASGHRPWRRTFTSASGFSAWSGPQGQPWPASAPADMALPLSRRSDPSMRSYLIPLAAGVRSELGSRVSTWVAHDTPETALSLDLTTWSPMRTTVYVNATGVLNTPGNQARLNQAARWFLRAANPTPQEPYARIDDWLSLDLRQPAARQWWLYGGDDRVSCDADGDGGRDGDDVALRGALDLLACGYHGLWLDNAEFDLRSFSVKPAGITQADWDAGLSQLLADLRAAMPPSASLAINTKWNDNSFAYSPGRVDAIAPRSVYAAEIAAAGQVIMEGGATLDPISRGGDFDMDASLRRQLRYADLLHGLGGRLQWEITNSTPGWTEDPTECQGQAIVPYAPWTATSPRGQSHARVARFNLATALLAYAPGDGIGDMCEYPGSGWAGYGRSIGTPLGARTETNEGAGTDRIITRAFTKGYVVINQGDAGDLANTTRPRTITLPRPAIDIAAPAGTPPVTAVTTTPGTALVMRYV